MQHQTTTPTGNFLVNEAAHLACAETPNYKVATAATAIFALDTLLSMANCGVTSFYFNAIATLLSASVAYNQYAEGAPLNKAKSMYAGLFGKTATKMPETPVAANNAELEVKAPTLAR